MLKKMFRSVKDEGAGGYIIHAEQPYEFYSSASTVRVKKSRRIIGHGMSHARGRRERHTWFWMGNPKEDLAISMRVIFKWTCIMTNITRKFLIYLYIYFCLTVGRVAQSV
jgi:hypothetical protein